MEFRSIISAFRDRFIDFLFGQERQKANISVGQHLLYVLSEEEKLAILDKIFPNLTAASTLVHIECPVSTPLEDPFHLRGWIASSKQIKKIWLVSSPDTKLAFEVRPDVAELFPVYQFVKGFSCKVEKKLIGSTIKLGYRTDKGDFTHIAMLALGESAEVRRQEKINKLARIAPYLICPACGSSFDQGKPIFDNLQAGHLNCGKCNSSYCYSPENYNFLPEDFKKQFDIVDTENVSSHEFDPLARSIIGKFSDGLILDCGAGYHRLEYPNVINLEVAEYTSTDILAVNEKLPFRDETFDAIFSFAVLEHVKDPFRSAQEIIRVLKRGGILYCVVPFLQPVHGYPNHFYNMTSQGLCNLFDRKNIEIVDYRVPVSGLPVWTLSWLLRSWANGLDNKTRENFLTMTVRDLIGEPADYLGQDFVSKLGKEKQFEIAATTMVIGQKK
jgi:SAM-dependent methyltransferase